MSETSVAFDLHESQSLFGKAGPTSPHDGLGAKKMVINRPIWTQKETPSHPSSQYSSTRLTFLILRIDYELAID